MTRVEGTDLFYYSAEIQTDALLSYVFIKDYQEMLTDPRVRRAVAGSIDQLRFFFLIWLPDIAHGEYGKQKPLLIVQRDELTRVHRLGKSFVHVETDRHRPHRTISKGKMMEYRGIVILTQETGKRIKSPVQNQFQIEQLAFVKIEGFRSYIRENGRDAAQSKGIDRGDKGEGGHNDLITRL